MSKLFISDLHLSPNNPTLIQLVCDFLQQQKAKEVYILGDIFNAWLGDDLQPDGLESFINTLTTLTTQGTRLFLMVGNRDFLLGKRFAKQVGGELIQDGYTINIGSKKALLMHGDSLCTDDVSYQRFRRIVRIRFLQHCFLLSPTKLRQYIANKIIQDSREKKVYKSSMIMDVNQDAVQKLIKSKNIDLLIHGHTHKPDIHDVNINNKSAHRIVLGDWDSKHVSYLLADNTQISLHDYRLENGVTAIKTI